LVLIQEFFGLVGYCATFNAEFGQAVEFTDEAAAASATTAGSAATSTTAAATDIVIVTV
jgi:hypothetical protein